MTAMIHDRALGLRPLLLEMVLCVVKALGSSTRSFAQLPSKSAPGSNVTVWIFDRASANFPAGWCVPAQLQSGRDC
jgi:hypothetical protein